jgi:hypothetical protein
MQRLLIDAEVESRPVSVSLEHVDVFDAVRKILDEAGVAFVVWGGNGHGLRVFAGDVDPALLTRAAGESEVPVETAQQDARLSFHDDSEVETTVEEEALEASIEPGLAPEDLDPEEGYRQLEQFLAPRSRQTSGLVVLPFDDENGVPLAVIVDPEGPKNALPFPGPDGKPMEAGGDDNPASPPDAAPDDPLYRQLLEALAPPSSRKPRQ